MRGSLVLSILLILTQKDATVSLPVQQVYRWDAQGFLSPALPSSMVVRLPCDGLQASLNSMDFPCPFLLSRFACPAAFLLNSTETVLGLSFESGFFLFSLKQDLSSVAPSVLELTM